MGKKKVFKKNVGEKWRWFTIESQSESMSIFAYWLNAYFPLSSFWPQSNIVPKTGGTKVYKCPSDFLQIFDED